MAAGNYNESKTMYGNYGSLFIDDSQVTECTALSAEATLVKVEVPMCGTTSKVYKTVGFDGKGTVTLNKVTSRMIDLMADDLRAGKDTVVTIISKVSDPGNGGTERIKLKGVKFDKLILASWGTGKISTEEIPFTFNDFEILDKIDPSIVRN